MMVPSSGKNIVCKLGTIGKSTSHSADLRRKQPLCNIKSALQETFHEHPHVAKVYGVSETTDQNGKTNVFS